jgi:hypothetical protein
MGGAGAHPQGWLQIVLPVVVLAVVFAVRWRRMSQDRPLRLERLWILPAIHLVVAGALFASAPPPPFVWALCAVAVAAGAALGWWRGRMMRIAIDPETHQLNHRGSPAALLFILGLVVVRQAMRNQTLDAALGLDAMAVTDIAISLAVGLFTAQRLEMFLRGRRLLAGAARG